MEHGQGHGHSGPRNLRGDQLKWQVRINLSEAFAAAARANPQDPALKPLLDVLAKYKGVLKHQKMSFAGFLPYFEDQEKPRLLQNISDALKAIDSAGDDVNAGIAAMKAYEAASAEYVERLRLYLWTKETLQRPGIEQKYATRFTVYADGGQEVYGKDIADALEADLKALMASGMVVKVKKFDSDPAHNPQAPRKFH